MAKFNKGLRSIEVHTRIGDVFSATDTVEKPIASWAYDEFIRGDKMHIFNDPKDYIPFHAVDYLVLTKSVGEVERDDAYCVDPSKSNEACKGEACSMELNC